MGSIVIAEHCSGAENLYDCFIPTQQQLLQVWFDLEMPTEPWAQENVKRMLI